MPQSLRSIKCLLGGRLFDFQGSILYNALASSGSRPPSNMKTKRTAIFLILGLAAASIAFADAREVRPGRSKIKVLATVFPLMEFARAVAGDRGDVGILLPPGAEIHSWQPRVSDIRKIARLDVFLFVGPVLEPWAEEILKNVGRPGLRTIEALRVLSPGGFDPAVPIREADGADPHVWLDFGLDLSLLDHIAKVFGEIDPDGAPFFSARANAYKDELRRLDAEYADAFRSCDEKTFVFGGHAAFGYLARRYGLEQVAVYGLSPDSGPTPKAMTEIIVRAKAKRIRTIFFEENVSDKMARLIAREIGADVRVLNPGDNLTKDELASGLTFLDLMRRNLESFKHGLGCR
jgi:zinc transport system substrate-binding protein